MAESVSSCADAHRDGRSLTPGWGWFRPATDGAVDAATGGAAEEFCAEHLFQQAVGKHRWNSRVLGAMPRQRCEFAAKEVGDVYCAGPRWRAGR